MHLPTMNPWVERRRSKPGALLRLFCFCHAGGSEAAFSGWQEALPDHTDVLPIHLPGRGRRGNEPPPQTSLIELAALIAQELVDELDRPFALFGHSMGALLAFEVARSLRDAYGVLPRLLAVSGCAAPGEPPSPIAYNLPDAEFLAELRRLNGTPNDILDNPEAMQLMLPVLRADFRLVDTYEYIAGAPLRCPITAFGGRADDISVEQLGAWRQQTTDRFAVELLDGDHFFLTQSRHALLDLMAAELRRVCW